MDGAKLVELAAPGYLVILNAQPGCFDVVGHDSKGDETHRVRLLAAPDVLTLAYVLPSSDPPALGYTCTPDFE